MRRRTTKGLESETTNSDLQHTWGVALPVTLGLEGKSVTKFWSYIKVFT